jgi:hypothetical protein
MGEPFRKNPADMYGFSLKSGQAGKSPYAPYPEHMSTQFSHRLFVSYPGDVSFAENDAGKWEAKAGSCHVAPALLTVNSASNVTGLFFSFREHALDEASKSFR